MPEVRIIPGAGLVVVQGSGRVKMIPRGGFFIDELVVVNGGGGGGPSYTLKRKRRREW